MEIKTQEDLFKLIKELFPECTAESLYAACKHCDEYRLLELIKYVQGYNSDKVLTTNKGE